MRKSRGRQSSRRRLLILLALLLLAATFLALDFDRFLSLATVREQHAEFAAFFRAEPIMFAAAFMAINVAALALCLPGAVLTLSLAGGAIFGFTWGTPIVLASVVIGDSIAFLGARYLVRGWVEDSFGHFVAIVDRGVKRNGAFYLLSLRFLAVIPFFIVNLAMGLTRMPLRLFAPVSFIGLLPATAIYVYAGSNLDDLDSPADIYSPQMIAAFLLLALLPFLAAVARSRFSRGAQDLDPAR